MREYSDSQAGKITIMHQYNKHWQVLAWVADPSLRFIHYVNLVFFLPLMFYCFTDPVDAGVKCVLVVEVCDGCP